MKKQSRIYKNDVSKEFLKLFDSIGQHRSKGELWSDFITMAACTISNACDPNFFDVREEMYKRCAKNYSKEDLCKIANLFTLVVLALEENPSQDFLGEIFSLMNFNDARKGQFFTPYSIASLMAHVTLNHDDPMPKGKKLAICDPACGAGGMLIACAEYFTEKGIDYQQKIMFVGQDIDPLAAKMCYIQLSLLGCDAIIKVGDSLSDPILENEPLTEKIWRTPIHVFGPILKYGLRSSHKNAKKGR